MPKPCQVRVISPPFLSNGATSRTSAKPRHGRPGPPGAGSARRSAGRSAGGHRPGPGTTGTGPGRAARCRRCGRGRVTLRVRNPQPAQELGEVAVVVWRQDQVPVVGRGAAGQRPREQPILGLAQDILEGGEVAVLAEEGGACRGPVEGVVDVAAAGTTRAPERNLTPRPGFVKTPDHLFSPFFSPSHARSGLGRAVARLPRAVDEGTAPAVRNDTLTDH